MNETNRTTGAIWYVLDYPQYNLKKDETIILEGYFTGTYQNAQGNQTSGTIKSLHAPNITWVYLYY